MIVDLMRNDLSHHAEPKTVSVTRLCDVETYATVHQLVSTIEATIARGRLRAAVVAAAYPPGSMTGAPKISSMDTKAKAILGAWAPLSPDELNPYGSWPGKLQDCPDQILEVGDVLCGQPCSCFGVPLRDAFEKLNMLGDMLRHRRELFQHQAPNPRCQVVIPNQDIFKVPASSGPVDHPVDPHVQAHEITLRVHSGQKLADFPGEVPQLLPTLRRRHARSPRCCCRLQKLAYLRDFSQVSYVHTSGECSPPGIGHHQVVAFEPLHSFPDRRSANTEAP